jgi:NAD(P)-dependent dehydrogenase (short-subunit alcohol dehydrogenase family)
MLQDQVIIVTGASQGIGRSIATACARERAAVVLAARSAGTLAAIAGAIRTSGGDALAVPTDVTDEAQVEHLVTQTLDHYGRITGLVNSAGVSPLAPVTETSLEVGIRVNALCPGPTDTPMREANFPGEDKSRLLAPEEVAEAAIYFFSSAAQHVRNAALDVRKQPRGWG